MTVPAGRVNVAFDDGLFVWDPAWVALDQAHPNLVTSYSIDRGRSYELDRTDAGRATVELADPDGILDPTNPGSPYLGHVNPMVQVLLCRWDPMQSEWQNRFRGWITDIGYVFDPSQQVNKLTIQLVDLFDILGAIDMQQGEFGDTPPPGNAGSVFFENNPMVTRIVQVLENSGPPPAGIPPDYYVVFSGNTSLTSSVYSPGESPLTVIQDAVDAEWPGVASVYVDRHGRLSAHGRYARFDPAGTLASFNWSSTTAYAVGQYVISGGDWYQCVAANTNQPPPNATYWKPSLPQWDFHEWEAGDLTHVESNPGGVAQLREFAFTRDVSKIINHATAYPQWILEGGSYRQIKDTEIAGQTVEDGTSVGLYGIRSWSAENLQTDQDLTDLSGGLVATKRYAQYYVANYAQPRNRISSVGFRSILPGRVGSEITWKLLSRVDISDQINVTVTSPGGGGFSAVGYYVEGVHETMTALGPDYDDVTVRLDLSPKAYFDDTTMFPPAP